jgi:hypothetical protein
MDENIALSLIHEDGEDQYISTRRPASQLASLLTKKLEKNTASWDLKSRKRFNIKLRRFGARNPEALASSRSLAHTSERLVLLSHIKSRTSFLHLLQLLLSTSRSNMCLNGYVSFIHL